jgi:hypothetical protein
MSAARCRRSGTLLLRPDAIGTTEGGQDGVGPGRDPVPDNSTRRGKDFRALYSVV